MKFCTAKVWNDNDDKNKQITKVEEFKRLRQKSLQGYVTSNTKSRITQSKVNIKARYFTKDPNVYSHGLFLVNTLQDIAINGKVPSLGYVKKRKVTDNLRFQMSLASEMRTYLQSRQMAIEAIIADHDGALLATANAVGEVCVYDVDEIQFGAAKNINLPQSEKLLKHKPILTFDVKKCVTAIAWSVIQKDEVAISFAFQSSVCIYDLDAQEEHSNLPKRKLDVIGGAKSGGNHTLLYFTKPKDLKEKEYIIASSNEQGYVRCWAIDPFSSNHQLASQWNMAVDQQRTSKTNHIIRVINIYPISSKTLLMNCFSDDGIVCIYDLLSTTTQTFGYGGGSQPKFLYRIDLSMSLGIVPDTASINGVTGFVQTFGCSQVLSGLLSLYSGTIFGVKINFASSALAITGKNKKIQTPSVEVHLITKFEHAKNVENTTTVTALSYEQLVQRDSNEMSSEARRQAQLALLPLLACNPKDSELSTDSILCITGIEEKIFKTLLSPTKFTCDSTDKSDIFLSKAQKLIRGNMQKTHDFLHPTMRDAFTGIIESSLQLNKYYSYTLLGEVLSAVHGSSEVIVNIDLSNYLVGESEAHSTFTRSSSIRFEIRDENSFKIENFDYNLTAVRGNVLQLNTPYKGPEIIHGFPKIKLRTKLIPGNWRADYRGNSQKATRSWSRVDGEDAPALGSITSMTTLPSSENSPGLMLFVGHSSGVTSVYSVVAREIEISSTTNDDDESHGIDLEVIDHPVVITSEIQEDALEEQINTTSSTREDITEESLSISNENLQTNDQSNSEEDGGEIDSQESQIQKISPMTTLSNTIFETSKPENIVPLTTTVLRKGSAQKTSQSNLVNLFSRDTKVAKRNVEQLYETNQTDLKYTTSSSTKERKKSSQPKATQITSFFNKLK